MELLIDDFRDLPVDAIAKNSQTAKTLLKLKCWDKVYFDHDLGLNSEHDGYQIMNWAIENDLLPKEVQLVTANPVGMRNMARALVAEGYQPNAAGILFTK
jgi:hypothetical protein